MSGHRANIFSMKTWSLLSFSTHYTRMAIVTLLPHQAFQTGELVTYNSHCPDSANQLALHIFNAWLACVDIDSSCVTLFYGDGTEWKSIRLYEKPFYYVRQWAGCSGVARTIPADKPSSVKTIRCREWKCVCLRWRCNPQWQSLLILPKAIWWTYLLPNKFGNEIQTGRAMLQITVWLPECNLSGKNKSLIYTKSNM